MGSIVTMSRQPLLTDMDMDMDMQASPRLHEICGGRKDVAVPVSPTRNGLQSSGSAHRGGALFVL